MREAFLESAGWAGAAPTPLAGDASRRRYTRLSRRGETAVLMEAPAGSGDDVRRFVDIALHLTGLGLSAPQILAASQDQGLLLLEDFGDALFPSVVATDPTLEARLYSAAIDALAVVQSVPAPAFVSRFPPAEMAQQATLAFHAYAGAPPGAACPYEAPLDAALGYVEPAAPVLMLRDCHAGNLFWLPDREGPAAVGLIDFQDARLAAPLYDVVSLLWDARRDISPDLRAALFDHATVRLGLDPDEAHLAAATLSAQRNLRILGIFARLAREEGKVGYVAHLPRVWRYVEEAVSHPRLGALAEAVHASLPPPDSARQASLRDPCPTTPTP